MDILALGPDYGCRGCDLLAHDSQGQEDSSHAVYRSACPACVEGRGVGGQQRIELLDEKEKERTTPIVAFDYGFMARENAS